MIPYFEALKYPKYNYAAFLGNVIKIDFLKNYQESCTKAFEWGIVCVSTIILYQLFI